MSIGFEKAGFHVVSAVDNDKDAVATLRANKKGNTAIFQEKVSSFLRNSKQGKAGYVKPGEVKHVHGSPPCKGFSRANRTGGKDDMINNKVSKCCYSINILFYAVNSLSEVIPTAANTIFFQGGSAFSSVNC
jgi:site-specific DNA-cytosine methylase